MIARTIRPVSWEGSDPIFQGPRLRLQLETQPQQALELPCTKHLACRDLPEIRRIHTQVRIAQQRFIQDVVRVDPQLKALGFRDAYGLARTQIEIEATGTAQ